MRLIASCVLAVSGFSGLALTVAADGQSQRVRTYAVNSMPRMEETFAYSCGFLDEDTFAFLFSDGKAQCGHLGLCSPRNESYVETKIPQPSGVKPKYSFQTYFESPHLWIGERGTLLGNWTLGGNGDHGIGALPRGADEFLVAHCKLFLESGSQFVAAPNGDWYLLKWDASVPLGFRREIYSVATDKTLTLEKLGSDSGPGHHNPLDGCFVSDQAIRLVWGEVMPPSNFSRLVSCDFDVKRKEWGKKETLLEHNRFTSFVEPRVITAKDKSVHYFWLISDGPGKSDSETGIFYGSSIAKKRIRLSSIETGFAAIALGDGVAICYPKSEETDTVIFRVIKDATPGPELVVKIGKRLHWGLLQFQYVLLGAAGDKKVWLTNTSDIRTFYEIDLSSKN